jgi:hypothetical protein
MLAMNLFFPVTLPPSQLEFKTVCCRTKGTLSVSESFEFVAISARGALACEETRRREDKETQGGHSDVELQMMGDRDARPRVCGGLAINLTR